MAASAADVWGHPRALPCSTKRLRMAGQQLQNRVGSPDPRLSLRQHRQMGRTCETGGSKFVDYPRSATEGVQRHGVWMSEDRCNPWPLSSTSSQCPKTRNEPRFRLVEVTREKRRTIMSFFPYSVGSLASVFSQFPNKTLSSLFGTKSITKKVNNQYLMAMKVRTRTMRLTISSLFKLL
jgi:hypothetical protein